MPKVKRNNTTYFIFKILTSGDGGVGKTTLIHRYIDRKFKDDYKSTIGMDITKKALLREIAKKQYDISIVIWDFGGQERFKELLEKCIELTGGGNGAIFMFDLTRPDTLINMREWILLMRRNNPLLPIIMVGTKEDLINDKKYLNKINKLALDKCEEYNLIKYFTTSSITGNNIDKVFDLLVDIVLKQANDFYNTKEKDGIIQAL